MFVRNIFISSASAGRRLRFSTASVTDLLNDLHNGAIKHEALEKRAATPGQAVEARRQFLLADGEGPPSTHFDSGK